MEDDTNRMEWCSQSSFLEHTKHCPHHFLKPTLSSAEMIGPLGRLIQQRMLYPLEPRFKDMIHHAIILTDPSLLDFKNR